MLMNAEAHKTLTELYDYLDKETIILFKPDKKTIKSYADMFYNAGYTQGYKEATKYAINAMKKDY